MSRPSRDPSQRRRLARELGRLLLVLGAAGLCIGVVRWRLFHACAAVKERDDTYFLPPPRHVSLLSLGYRAAVADALWAHVLVSQGLHSFEHRRFQNLAQLYDVVYELDPAWQTPYLLADALFTFQVSGVPPLADVLKAREILERGAKQLPNDAEIWLNLGQFVGFVAPPSYLADSHPELAQQWRVEGAQMLARAAELGAGELSNVSWQAIGGASVLERAGEREAAIRFLERTRAVTDDPELRQYVEQKLARLLGERWAEGRLRVENAARDYALATLPALGRTSFAVLGPPYDGASCAGPERADEPRCATSWAEWARRFAEQSPAAPDELAR